MRKAFLSMVLVPLLTAAAPGTFPNPDRSWRGEPALLTLDEARTLRLGMSKRQIYHSIGEPHFSEGLGSRVWNYNLQVGPELCQLQLQFKKRRVTRMSWSRESCTNSSSS